MLLPKRVKYRRVHRGRMKGKALRGNTVTYGEYGLQAIEPGAFLRWFETRGEDGEIYLCAQSAQQDPEIADILRARGLEGMTGTALWRPSSARGTWTI